MPESESPLERALKYALMMFPAGPVLIEDVERNCTDAIRLLQMRHEEYPDLTTLVREVENRVMVRQERSTSLQDRTGHEDWLATRRSQINWGFWDRYRRYLEQEELIPPAVISRLDESTDRVLANLESPDRIGEWDRRGLVVGHVQSGKTGHYTGLACKAADAGYQLIVVLAGMHNSLRSQAQLRLDQGLLGFDTQFQFRTDSVDQRLIGAGALPGAPDFLIGSLTDSTEQGDFKRDKAKRFNMPLGSMPVILVVKKYGTILKNLHEWVTRAHGYEVNPGSHDGKWIVPEIPMLVIDDEADNASINTRNVDVDPTVINQRIRTILKVFDKSAYVGYTATPFANIYSATAEDEEFGMDLFPRHFIENLKPPSNYFGPTRVFGLTAGDGTEVKESLPIFRQVADYADWMPDKHSRDWRPDPKYLPPTLKESVLAFILVCAVRRLRGQQTKHSSMLIHTTRFQDVQQLVAEQVQELLMMTRYRLRYGDGDAASARNELRKLWKEDFEPTSAAWDAPVDPLSWDDLWPHVEPAIDKIQLRVINGSSQDALEYYEHRRTGLSVIAIGGNKLSRGLTLEGLSVSYYLRATTMYDTLMQMGRWFGYRPGYEDLCRLYTTTELRDWYQEITTASEELRADFDEMAERKAMPEDYGLRVRRSAAGLTVTAPSKMRSAKTISMSFSGDISESVTFDVDDAVVEKNVINLEDLIKRLKSGLGVVFADADMTNRRGGNYIWKNVGGDVVADFFDGYLADPMALRAKPQLLSRYIRDGVRRRELTDWTVVLVTNSSAQHTKPIDGLSVGLTIRRHTNTIEEIRSSSRYTIRRVVSPADESIDLTLEQREAAMAALRTELRHKATDQEPYKEPKYPRGATLRRQRTPQKALLLIYVLDNVDRDRNEIAKEPIIGFAASFPFSPSQLTASYRVNETWVRQMLDEMPNDDDDE